MAPVCVASVIAVAERYGADEGVIGQWFNQALHVGPADHEPTIALALSFIDEISRRLPDCQWRMREGEGGPLHVQRHRCLGFGAVLPLQFAVERFRDAAKVIPGFIDESSRVMRERDKFGSNTNSLARDSGDR